MKKIYIAPNLTCVKVELQSFIADSPVSNNTTPKGEITGTGNNMTLVVEKNQDLEITAKHYDAWTTWDE